VIGNGPYYLPVVIHKESLCPISGGINRLMMIRYQPINDPTAGTQAFLMDYTQGERVITHHAGPVRVGYYDD
jgi:hypothetical protein